MNRVLVPSSASWYHGLRAVSYYSEGDVERWILTHAKSLFSDYHVFPFKQSITTKTREGPKRPDLAMIRKDFSAWSIIEVELEDHTFEHISSQVSVFLNGDYNAHEVAKYAHAQMTAYCETTVDKADLVTLVDRCPPSVIVMIDGERGSLEKDLKDLGVGLCIFEIYKSTVPEFLFRTVGDYPQVAHKEVHCKREKNVANTLELLDSSVMNLKDNTEVDIRCHDVLTRWAVIRSKHKTYLKFLGVTNPLNPNSTLALCRDGGGNFFFKYI